eukprot:6011408-Karenia_brevis.AAC.1
MPLCTWLTFVDVILSSVLNQFVDLHFPPIPGIFHGGGKGTSASSVHLQCRLTLEKGADRMGTAAIAQADVEKFYDS